LNEGIQESLFEKMVQEIMREKRVTGSIHRGVFIPKVYEDAVDRAILSFFNQNGFISYDRVESMISSIKSGTNATKNYLKEKVPDGIPVSTGVVGQTLCDTLDGSIDEALTDNTPLDMMTVVPSQLEKEDIRKLLQHCPSIEKHRQHLKKEPFVLFNGSYLLTAKNIDDIVKSFEDRAKNDVQKVLSTQPKKLQVSAKVEKEEEDSDEEDNRKGKKSGGKGKRRAGNKKSKKDDEPEQDSSSKLQDKALLALVPKQKDILDSMEKLLKDDAPSQYDSDEDLIDEIIKYFTPLLQQLYLKTKENIYLDTASDRRKQHQDFEKRLQDLYSEVQVNYKAINSLVPDDKADRKKVDENSLQYKLEKYLIKTKCTYIVFLISENQALHHQLTVDTSVIDQLMKEPEIDEDKLSSEMNKVVRDIIKRLPKEEDQKILTALQNSLQSGMEDLLTKLNETAEHFNLFLRQLDKKKEKQYLAGKKQELKSMVIPQLIDPARLLLGLIVYVFLSRSNLLIHAPGKLVQALVQYLQKNVLTSDDDSDVLDVLTQAQQLVTKYIIALRKAPKDEQFLFEDQEQLDSSLNQAKIKLIGASDDIVSEPNTPTTEDNDDDQPATSSSTKKKPARKSRKT
jgi:hypothetical protein